MTCLSVFLMACFVRMLSYLCKVHKEKNKVTVSDK